MKELLVVIACGWSRPPESPKDYGALCPVAKDRLKRALELYNPNHMSLAVSGNVPFDAVKDEDATLASSMKSGIIQSGVPKDEILIVEGLNAFSESNEALEMAWRLDFECVTIVSSDFYLTAYGPMWRAKSRRWPIPNFRIESVSHADGVVSPDVIDFYGSSTSKARLMARFASTCIPASWLATTIADKMTASRKTVGFQMSGCQEIG